MSDPAAAGRSLDRGLAILNLLAGPQPEWRVADMAEALAAPLASIYRVVKTLTRLGYLDRSEVSGRYRLGIELARLGGVVLERLDIRAVSEPVMRQLTDELGETVELLVPRGTNVVCLAKIEGSFPIRPQSIMIGEHLPFNSGAAAYAILAFLPDETRAQILAELDAHQFTEHTLTSPARIDERCARIRADGYAYSRGELVLGTAALAAPIFGSDGIGPAGSVSVTGIDHRIVGMETAVVRAAAEISRQLGGSVGPRGQA